MTLTALVPKSMPSNAIPRLLQAPVDATWWVGLDMEPADVVLEEGT